MSEFVCSCCGGRESKLLYSRMTSVYSSNNWKIAECINCSNIVTQPVPEEKMLNDLYSNTYLYPVHRLILAEKKNAGKKHGAFHK